MSDMDDLKTILVEIRDNQRRALEVQESQLALARDNLAQAGHRVEELLALQRQALSKVISVGRVAPPAIILCVLPIIYPVVRYL